MSKTEVMAVIIRLFSISLFIIAINYIPQLLELMKYEITSTIYANASLIIVMFLTSIYLWFFPQTTAIKILPKPSEIKNVKWDNDNILSIGFIITGVFLLYKVISDLTYWLFIMFYAMGNNPQIKFKADDKIAIYVTLVELVLSLLLVFGSRGISNLILKFRGKIQ